MSRYASIFSKATPFLICLFLPALSIPLPLEGQANPAGRTFVIDGKRANDPIQVLGFRVGGRMIAPEERLEASDEEWLQNSTMIVKNVSQREAVDIELFLSFPESEGPSTPAVGDRLWNGSPPPEGMYSPAGKRLAYPAQSSFSLAPGQSVEILLGEHFSRYRFLLEQRKPIRELSICRVRFVNVYFRNGMKWSPNYFGRPDPEHVGRYVEMLPSAFYEYHPKA